MIDFSPPIIALDPGGFYHCNLIQLSMILNQFIIFEDLFCNLSIFFLYFFDLRKYQRSVNKVTYNKTQIISLIAHQRNLLSLKRHSRIC